MTRARTKSDKTVYQIEITGEQIMLMRSLSLRAEMMYAHSRAEEYVTADGTVEHKIVHSCYFCRKGSYESVSAIPHDKKCIMAEIGEEWEKLNAQFIKVLGREMAS